MGLQAYDLVLGLDDERIRGAVIVDLTSGLPLPISFRAFEDAEDAERFIAWCGRSLRACDPGDAQRLVGEWAMVRDWADSCDDEHDHFCACGRRPADCDGSRKGCNRAA